MGAGRTGTVTFLFTDIEGSTERWSDDGAGMSAALERHDAALDDAIGRHGGRIFKHTGDGVAAVFDSATSAVHAALAARTALDLPVRMGLHTGEAEQRDGDFFGPVLNRCARIMDAGHGGQILISSTTRQLLGDLCPTDVIELGPHRLKGLDEPVIIHQIGAEQHPPLRAVSGDVRLPVVPTELIGRHDLIGEVVATIDEHRLVTLTGAGGTGKTRLAIAAARERAERHNLVVFVDLSEISDDEEVIPAVCRSLGVADHRLGALELALSGRSVLLVFDNCEHVLGAVADVVDALVDNPALRILCTSREGLGSSGERLVAIPGLPTGDAGSAAVEMFVQRAETGSPGTRFTDDDLAVVRDICRRLDGLPLAIELAAARVGVLSPRDLLGRLDERFELLTGGRRKRNRDRQRTLRETIDWSFDLLDDAERDMFELVSVFGGSFALDSAVAMASARPEYEVLDLLQALIDKSLLTTVDADGHHRYRYLETIRSYAEERFDARPDADSALERREAHLVSLVHAIVDDLEHTPRRAASRLRAEIPNLRRAFDHAIGRRDAAAACALIGPLAGVMDIVDWRIGGWAAEALALDGVADSRHEAALLAVQLSDRWREGRFDLLHELADRTAAAAESHGALKGAVLGTVAAAYQLSGDDASCDRYTHAYAQQSERDGDHALSTRARAVVAWLHTEPAALGSPPTWTDEDEAAVADAIDHPNLRTRHTGLMVRALRARWLGDYELMLRDGDQIVGTAVPGSPTWFTGLQIHGMSEFYLGRMAAAIGIAAADLDEAYRLGDRSAMVIPLLVDALVLESLGELDAAATIRGRLPRRLTVMFIRELADLDRRLRERLEPDRWHDLVTTGARILPRQLQELTHQTAGRHVDLDRDARVRHG